MHRLAEIGIATEVEHDDSGSLQPSMTGRDDLLDLLVCCQPWGLDGSLHPQAKPTQ